MASISKKNYSNKLKHSLFSIWAKIVRTWHTRRGTFLAIGSVLLVILGIIADITGIMSFVGIQPFDSPGGREVVTPPNPTTQATVEQSVVISSSPIVQATIGPTPIPLPPSLEIQRDDFSSSFSGWDNYSKSKFATGYENGKYFIELLDADMLFLSIWKGIGEIDNGVLQVDILGPLGESGAASQGLGFGWRPNWEGSTYAFTVSALGACTFLEAKDGWRGKVKGKVNGFDNKRSYHTLRVYIRNGEATGYVDDLFCAVYSMPNYERGYVGVVASDWNDQGKSYFDEYRIFRLP